MQLGNVPTQHTFEDETKQEAGGHPNAGGDHALEENLAENAARLGAQSQADKNFN